MPAHRTPRRRSARRRAAIAIGVLVVFSTWAGEAYAQTPDGPSAVDQYVEDVPTSGGATVPGKKNKPKKNSLPPAVSNSINQQGGSDAGILREVATSPDYGAPATSPRRENSQDKPNGQKGERKDAAAQGAQGTARGASPEGHLVPGPQDSSPSEALSAAVSAVQGGDAARMVGLLVVLFLISVAALATAALRHRRRAL